MKARRSARAATRRLAPPPLLPNVTHHRFSGHTASAWSITIAPPVATDRNTSVTNALIVPTILAAAMAASPVLATIAVESTLIKQMKN